VFLLSDKRVFINIEIKTKNAKHTKTEKQTDRTKKPTPK